MKNILHINTNDLRGGAAKVMMRLVESQNSLGLNSKVIVGHKESNHPMVYPFDIKKQQEVNFSGEGYVDYDVLGAFSLYENPLFQKADVIHLHNIHGNYFHPYALSLLSHLKPVVWTLHDMQSITGHCSYSFECNKWLTGCGECPHPEEYPTIQIDRTHLNWIEKKDIYSHSKLFIAPVAKWIGDRAHQGILNSHPMKVILNGVDVETYKPMDKVSVREKYSIPQDKIVIGAVANGGTFGQERKGGKYVQRVIDQLIEVGYDILLVNVGGAKQGYEHEHLYHIGYISSEKEMAEVYNTFDLYLFPSLADTCPLVISEAMACGVPVVTFATGGIPELVQNGQTGYVAPQKDIDKLYEYTEKLIADVELRERFSKASRSYSVAHFDHAVVLKCYIDVYEKAIQQFEKGKKDILYFDLNCVPDVVKKQPEFLNSERIRGKENIENSYKKPKLSIVSNGMEDVSEADVVYVKREKFLIADGFFENMLYKGMNTDVISGDVVLKRNNNKSFYKNISPVFKSKKIIDTSFGSLFYSKEFFEKNKNAILYNEKIEYESIESFSIENISITIDDFMKLLVNKPIYIYGAGTHTIELLNESSYLSNLVIKIIDRNLKLIGTKLLDRFEIIPPHCANKDIPILISSASFEEEIYEQLSNSVKNPIIKIYNN